MEQGKRIPKVLITFKENGQNGGPFISHQRIIDNEYLKTKYDFERLWIPRARFFLNPFNYIKFIRRIKKAHPDIVHITGLQLDGFLSMFACRIAKVKTVLVVRGSSSEALGINRVRKSIINQLEKYTLKKATYVYGVSDYVSSWKICKYAKNYYGTIYNFPAEKYIINNSFDIRQELGIPATDVVIVSSGRITKDKGFDTLCNVIKQFKNSDNVRFVIVGNGDYKEQFDKVIENEGLQQRVSLLGYRPNVCDILKGADIFIICTKHETLCNSVIEAATMSLPLVVSNVGGLPEIVDSSCGYLVDPYDEKEFVICLEKLISSRNLRKTMGENACNIIKTKFSPFVIEKKLDELYQSVLK